MFGEKVKGYEVPVLNEREVRAAAGIMFLFAVFAFSNAWFVGNFTPIKITVLAFLIEFAIRVINPKYAPSMILGRLVTINQNVEYVGAPQKRFAWAIGLGLAIFMTILVVLFNVKGPLNLGICFVCLGLLFAEAAFGICVGCKIYNLISKKQAKHCPGGVCQIKMKHPIQKIKAKHYGVLGIFVFLIFSIAFFNLVEASPIETNTELKQSSESIELFSEKNSCEVPQWATNIGHEELYKRHHGCGG